MKTISVIIPAYEDAGRLERTLRALREIRAGEYPALELVVAVRPSRDRTAEVARELADVVTDGGNASRGRNRGAAAAHGEILVLLDADAVPAAGTITAVAAAAAPGVLGTCTAYPGDRSALARLTALSINFLRWSGLVKGLSNLLFFERAMFERDGVRYDENRTVGEHHDFVRRARARGWAFTYVRARRGYMIDTTRHREWGYFPLLFFWLKWSFFNGLLGLDARRLEEEYWSRRRGGARREEAAV